MHVQFIHSRALLAFSSAVSILILATACGDGRDLEADLARRRGQATPAGTSASSSAAPNQLQTAGLNAAAAAINTAAQTLDSGSNREEPGANALARTSSASAFSWDVSCTNGGTASAGGEKSRTVDENLYQVDSSANLDFSGCASYSSVQLDGSVIYSRHYALTDTERVALTVLDGSISSSQAGAALCNVTYDNVSLNRYANFSTGVLSHTVSGSVLASCTAVQPTATPVPTPTATPTSGGGSGYNTTTVTVVCTFSNVPLNAMSTSIEAYCTVTQ